MYVVNLIIPKLLWFYIRQASLSRFFNFVRDSVERLERFFKELAKESEPNEVEEVRSPLFPQPRNKRSAMMCNVSHKHFVASD